MKKSVFLSLTLCTLFAAVAMAAETPAVSTASTPTPPAAEKSAPAPSSAHPALPADSQATPAPAAAEPVQIAGKVLQTMNGGGYTYVYIERSDGSKKWVAVAETPVKVGSDIVFKDGMEMGAFESKALKRTSIWRTT